MDIKAGWKTVELWLGGIITLAAVLVPSFPKESLMAVLTWVGARLGLKAFGTVDPTTGKSVFATSEFWVAIVAAALPVVFPDLPKDKLSDIYDWAAIYIGGRTTVKALGDFDIGETLKNLVAKK
jgi:hypothetical protein